jgi:hypothetical protein
MSLDVIDVPIELDAVDWSGLVGAIRRGELEQVKKGLTEVPDVDVQVDGMSLLFIAVFKQQLPVAEYLLSRGANAHLRNDDGLETPLILARRRNDAELIRLLMTPKEKLVGSTSGLSGFAALLESPAVPVLPADALPLRASLSTQECSVCFCDDEKLARLERCGHGCCGSCLAAFLKTNVDDQIAGTSNPIIRCFARGCTESVSFRDIERFAPAETSMKYATRLALAAVRLMDDFSWCTKCESGGIVPATRNAVTPCVDVHCDGCSHEYCSICREDAHPGLTCNQKYEQMMLTDHFRVEILSAKELRRSSKPCPNCTAPTTRDGGCSHMTCKACAFAWCWLCGGPYVGRYTFNNKCPCGS